ncbi:MAG: RDD family protein [Magnetospirillum sp.]|nr:RDD family protein [Magnetospirillum sp.]
MDAHTAPPVIDAVVNGASATLPDFSGLRRRRMFAWAIDAAICCVLAAVAAIPAFFLGVFSFGILWAPAWFAVALVPMLYHAILLAGPRGATWGMRFAGVEFTALVGGGRPSFLQALVHWVLFYMGVGFSGGLILLWSLFDPNKALLHDRICGVAAHRAAAGGKA